MTYLWVGIAGMLGAMLRYLIGVAIPTNSTFPYTTLMINLIGCFLLSWFTTFLFDKIKLSPIFTTAISTGFIGSFTTFSTFSVETVRLFQSGKLALGVLYIILSLFGGLLMSRLGFRQKQVKNT